MVGATGYPNYCAPRITRKIYNYYIYKLKIQYYIILMLMYDLRTQYDDNTSLN